MKRLILALLVTVGVGATLHADTTTPRMSLTLPAYNDPRWDLLLNANFTTIDGLVPLLSVFNNWTSSNTFAGTVNFSSNVYMNGSAGSVGQVLTSNGGGIPSWATPSNTASAGGSNTQVQFNNAGVLAGSPNMTWSGSTFTVTDISASTETISSSTITNLTVTTFNASASSITYSSSTQVYANTIEVPQINGSQAAGAIPYLASGNVAGTEALTFNNAILEFTANTGLGMGGNAAHSLDLMVTGGYDGVGRFWGGLLSNSINAISGGSLTISTSTVVQGTFQDTTGNVTISTESISSSTITNESVSSITVTTQLINKNGLAQFNSAGYLVGSVVQWKQFVDTNTTSTGASTSYIPSTTTVTITPKTSTDVVKISFSGAYHNSNAASEVQISLFRGATDLDITGHGFCSNGDGTGILDQIAHCAVSSFYDSPGTVSAVTYTVKIKSPGGTTANWNYSYAGGNTGSAVITAEEIAQTP